MKIGLSGLKILLFLYCSVLIPFLFTKVLNLVAARRFRNFEFTKTGLHLLAIF